MEYNSRLEEIKDILSSYQKRNDAIHVSLQRAKKRVCEVPCQITGIYPDFFYVKSKVEHYEESFCISYKDLYTGMIIVKELAN